MLTGSHIRHAGLIQVSPPSSRGSLVICRNLDRPSGDMRTEARYVLGSLLERGLNRRSPYDGALSTFFVAKRFNSSSQHPKADWGWVNSLGICCGPPIPPRFLHDPCLLCGVVIVSLVLCEVPNAHPSPPSNPLLLTFQPVEPLPDTFCWTSPPSYQILVSNTTIPLLFCQSLSNLPSAPLQSLHTTLTSTNPSLLYP